MILKRFSYSLQNVNNIYNLISPFWIDMSSLYEIYVYSLLYKKYGDTIQFQVEGSYGSAVDFIKKDEILIIDTKYKPKYNDGYSGILQDVRQISGYARDNKILKELGGSNDTVVPCIIIYPEKTEKDDILIENFTAESLRESASSINGFNKFYKHKRQATSIIINDLAIFVPILSLAEIKAPEAGTRPTCNGLET